MNKLQGAPGELRATIHIKRKATGKVETYELVGRLNDKRQAKVHGSTGAVIGEGSKLTTDKE